MGTECRSCMSSSSAKYVQMDSLMEENFSYLDYFNECTKLNAAVDDDLPSIFCKHCVDLLHTVYRFVKLAKKVDTEFRTVLQYFDYQEFTDEKSTDPSQNIEASQMHVISTMPSQNSAQIDENIEIEEEYEDDIRGDFEFDLLQSESSDDSIGNLDSDQEPVEIVDPLPFEPDDHYLIEYNPKEQTKLKDDVPANAFLKWKCAVCNVWLRGDVSQEGHTNMHSNMYPYKCVRCSCKFRSREYLERHDKYDHKFIPLAVRRKLRTERTCQVCGIQFKSVKKLNAHYCGGKPKPVKKEPRKKAPLPESFQRPKKRLAESLKIPNFRIACPSCNETFTSVRYLGLHNCQRKQAATETKKKEVPATKPPSSLKLTCLSCSETFTSINELSKHNCKIKEEKSAKVDKSTQHIVRRTCWACSHIFRTCLELKRHKCKVEQKWLEYKKLADQGFTNFPCLDCSTNFSTMKSLAEHICDDGKSFRAAYPSFAQQVEYDIEVITAPINEEVSKLVELEDGTVKCPYCDVHLEKEAIHKHVRKDHPDKYRIGRKPGSKYVTVTDKDFVCEYCEEEFLTIPEKRTHMLEEHHEKVGTEINEKGEVIVKCEICKAIITKRFYPRHMMLHQKSANSSKYTAYMLQCAYCSQTFPHTVALSNHESEMHGDQKDKPRNECTYCFKKYFHFRLLKKHIYNIHLQKYACKCPGCGKKFKSQEDLLIHKSANQYECEICQKIFNCHGGFRRHVNEHKNGKKWVCELCGRVMATQLSLKVHLRSHERGTLKGMPIDKVFSYKRYFCFLCENASFGKRNRYLHHLKMEHDTTIDEEDLREHFRYTAKPNKLENEIDDTL